MFTRPYIVGLYVYATVQLNDKRTRKIKFKNLEILRVIKYNINTSQISENEINLPLLVTFCWFNFFRRRLSPQIIRIDDLYRELYLYL